jgi:hypothetical protein
MLLHEEQESQQEAAIEEQKPLVLHERITPTEEAEFLLLVYAAEASGQLTEREAAAIIDREYALQMAARAA